MHLIRTVFVLISIFWLVGCATAAAMTGPDGTPHQLVKCAVMEKCYEKAREVCSGNYKIVNSTKDGGENGAYELLVKCTP